MYSCMMSTTALGVAQLLPAVMLISTCDSVSPCGDDICTHGDDISVMRTYCTALTDSTSA